MLFACASPSFLSIFIIYTTVSVCASLSCSCLFKWWRLITFALINSWSVLSFSLVVTSILLSLAPLFRSIVGQNSLLKMSKDSSKIELEPLDGSIFKDCSLLCDYMKRSPVLTSSMGGEDHFPILQGLDNLEKLVYFNSPDRSLASTCLQSEEDIGTGIFPLWQPCQVEDNVYIQPFNPLEDMLYHVDDMIPYVRFHFEPQFEVQEPLEVKRRRGRPRKHAAEDPNVSIQDSSKCPKTGPDYVLPPGWKKLPKPHPNGRCDMLYIEEETQHQCRSRPEIGKYLNDKAKKTLEETSERN